MGMPQLKKQLIVIRKASSPFFVLAASIGGATVADIPQ